MAWLKNLFKWIGIAILLTMPVGIVWLAQWLFKDKKTSQTINKTFQVNENVLVILKNGKQKKTYDSRRRIRKWRKC